MNTELPLEEQVKLMRQMNREVAGLILANDKLGAVRWAQGTLLSDWGLGELSSLRVDPSILPNVEELPTDLPAEAWKTLAISQNELLRSFQREITTLKLQLAQLPDVCDGKEQPAFEAHLKHDQLPTDTHPLHYIFLDERSSAARHAWRAAITYCRRAVGDEVFAQKQAVLIAEQASSEAGL